MANSNRKKARKLQVAKKANAAEREKAAKKVKPAEEKPIKYTITAEQQADGTFEFHGGKGGFNIIKQKNKVLEPYGKHYVIYDELVEGIPGTIKNKVRIMDDRKVEIIKSGITNTHMVFEKDKINMTQYETPYGEMMIGVFTKDIRFEEQDEKITVHVNYALDINGDPVADCNIDIKITALGR